MKVDENEDTESFNSAAQITPMKRTPPRFPQDLFDFRASRADFSCA